MSDTYPGGITFSQTQQAIDLQGGTSYEGYVATNKALNCSPQSQERNPKIYRQDSWMMVTRNLSSHLINFFNNQHNGDKDNKFPFTLLISPNRDTTHYELQHCARDLGKIAKVGAHLSTGIWDKYKDGALSGYVPNSPFSINAKWLWSKPLTGTVTEQSGMVEQLRDENPGITFEAPTIMDMLVYYQTLLASNSPLVGHDGADYMHRKYQITQFNLMPTEYSGQLAVPSSFIYRDGMPYIEATGIDSITSSHIVVS